MIVLMKTIYGLSKFRGKFKSAVVAIGVFDGLHRGHRYLLQKALSAAKRLHRPCVCVTFHPHPKGQPYLISLAHRLKLIEAIGIDYCLVIYFNEHFARISASDFIRDVLVARLGALFIFVGENFHFGCNAQGDAALLKQNGGQYGFKVRAVKELNIGGKKASSQRIRALIQEGNLGPAEKILGRKVSVLGSVIKGNQRGRILGYPTANINPHHEVLPKEGVYAIKAVYNKKEYNGICNIGRRPTFGSPDEAKTIEVHLFDFHKNIYGKDLEIAFIHKIREEKKFPSSASLILQIKKDEQKSALFLHNRNSLADV